MKKKDLLKRIDELTERLEQLESQIVNLQAQPIYVYPWWMQYPRDWYTVTYGSSDSTGEPPINIKYTGGTWKPAHIEN